MKLDEITKKNHERLSKTYRKFLEYVENHPECVSRSTFKDINWPDPAVTLQPWPTFVNTEFADELENAAISVFNLIKSIPKRVFDNNPHKIAAAYETRPDRVSFALTGASDKYLKYIIGRGDFVFSELGFKCVEYNIASNLGGWELPLWEVMYKRNPIISDFIKTHKLEIVNKHLLEVLFEHLIRTVLENDLFVNNNEEEINIAIAISQFGGAGNFKNDPLNMTAIYRRVLQRVAGNYTGNLMFCSLDMLKTRGNGMYCNNKRVYTLLKRIPKLVSPDVLMLFAKGDIVILNSPIVMLFANKANIAFLSENEESPVFTPEERAAISKYVPWSRKTVERRTSFHGDAVDLKSFLLKNKDRLVLKPFVGLGGVDVCYGKNFSTTEWDAIVGKAFRDRTWVAQEFIEPLSFLYQWGESGTQMHQAVWGAFAFGNNYGSEWLRVIAQEKNAGVINSKQGACESLVLRVKE